MQRGQKTDNRDFASDKLLSMERSANEVTWSAGARIDSDTVAKAFPARRAERPAQAQRRRPFTAARIGIIPVIVILIAILLVLALLSRCSRCDPCRGELHLHHLAQLRGSSYGGSSSGGGQIDHPVKRRNRGDPHNLDGFNVELNGSSRQPSSAPSSTR